MNMHVKVAEQNVVAQKYASGKQNDQNHDS